MLRYRQTTLLLFGYRCPHYAIDSNSSLSHSRISGSNSLWDFATHPRDALKLIATAFEYYYPPPFFLRPSILVCVLCTDITGFLVVGNLYGAISVQVIPGELTVATSLDILRLCHVIRTPAGVIGHHYDVLSNRSHSFQKHVIDLLHLIWHLINQSIWCYM